MGCVQLVHHRFWLQLLASSSMVFTLSRLWNIIDEDPVPETCVWSILWILSDFKMLYLSKKKSHVFRPLDEGHCWWTIFQFMTCVDKPYGWLRFIRSVLRPSIFSSVWYGFKLGFLVYYTMSFGLKLFGIIYYYIIISLIRSDFKMVCLRGKIEVPRDVTLKSGNKTTSWEICRGYVGARFRDIFPLFYKKNLIENVRMRELSLAKFYKDE